MKHTKGEWIINKSLAPFTGLKDEMEISSADMSEPEWIALCHNEANAKLIAAAPELLQSAMELLSWKGEVPKHCRENLQNAIKKATE